MLHFEKFPGGAKKFPEQEVLNRISGAIRVILSHKMETLLRAPPCFCLYL